MQFVSEIVTLNNERITIVFPIIKHRLLNNKLAQFTESKLSFASIERFVILNGGYVKEPF